MSGTAESPTLPTGAGGKSGNKVILGLGAVAVAVVGLYLLGRPGQKPDPCEVALTQAAGLLAAGNAAGARSQTVMAMASCNGEARTKASDMLAAADKTLAAQAACERSFRQIGSLISDRRPLRARSAFDQMDTACVESPQGQSLREKIDAGQASAVAADAEVRRHLAAGDLEAARAALDQVLASNREYPDLPALRHELQSAAKSLAAAPQAAATPSSAPQHQPPATAPAQTAPAPVFTPAVSPQAETAQALLRDAENALRQLKFDAAKTYVESARRFDPHNPQAAALARRIKERELQYLSEETSIK